jgi:hypothetical protein
MSVRPRRAARRARARQVVLATALVALVAACGSTGPTPVASGRTGSTTPTTPAASGTRDAASQAPGSAVPSPPAALFGTFRRAPIPVPPDVLHDATALCRTKPVPPYAEEIGSRPVVVSDLRGLGVVLLVFADGQGATGCRVEVNQAGGMRATHFAVSSDPHGPLDPGGITLGAMQYVTEGTNQRVIAVGRAGERAVHVRAGFDDDTYVTAALANGWYAMWWPGSIRPAVIVAGNNRNEAMGKITPP